jgi:predicted nucleotidyltransferase
VLSVTLKFEKNYYLAVMLTKLDIENKLQAIKPVLADKFHVSSIGYFGSYSTGQQNDQSDLDLLVEFSQPIGWEFFTLECFLEQSLGLRVDLVTRNALKEQIKESILKQVKYI